MTIHKENPHRKIWLFTASVTAETPFLSKNTFLLQVWSFFNWNTQYSINWDSFSDLLLDEIISIIKNENIKKITFKIKNTKLTNENIKILKDIEFNINNYLSKKSVIFNFEFLDSST